MAIEWPADVNQDVLRRTINLKPELSIDEFQVDEGPPLTGRDSTADSDVMSWDTIWSEYELLRMIAFIRDDLAGGTQPVIRLHPLFGTSEEMTFVPGSPYQVRDRTVGRFQVTLNMRRMP